MKLVLEVSFSSIFGTGQVQDQNMMKDKLIDVDSKSDDYSILPKIRNILLHRGYELTEKDFLMSCQMNV